MFAYMRAAVTRLRATGDDAPLELLQTLEDLSEALIPESRKREMEELRRRIEEAGEVRDLIWLAKREQSTAYAPRYSTPTGYPRTGGSHTPRSSSGPGLEAVGS